MFQFMLLSCVMQSCRLKNGVLLVHTLTLNFVNIVLQFFLVILLIDSQTDKWQKL